MNNNEKNILVTDFKYILEKNLDLELFKDKTVLITGATGLIGSLLVKFFLFINAEIGVNVKVLALVRNIKKAESIFEGFALENLFFIVHDMNEDCLEMTENVDYIIHAASITNSKMMIANPVEVINLSVVGTKSILELALKKNCQKVIYLSSMEVYGQPSNPDEEVDEEKLGYIDLSNIRSCYPESKRLCECLCNSYYEEYGVEVVRARLAQTFGAGILPGENRVFAQFAKSVVNGEDIVLHTKGLSEGNYVYTADAIYALVVLMLRGKSGEAYNIVNENCHMTISQMAKLVSTEVSREILGKAVNVIYDIPSETSRFGYAPDVKMKLSGEKMRLLGWKPTVELKSAYIRMVNYMNSKM